MFLKFRVHFSVMTSYRTALRAGLQMAHRPSLLICIANDHNWIVIIHFIYLYECNWISSHFFWLVNFSTPLLSAKTFTLIKFLLFAIFSRFTIPPVQVRHPVRRFQVPFICAWAVLPTDHPSNAPRVRRYRSSYSKRWSLCNRVWWWHG